MKVKIPWQVKIIVKIILSRLPFNYVFWQSLGLFRHGQMDNTEYALNIFNSHIEKSGLTNDLKGKTILELGPGDSIATAIIAAAYGAKAILIDAGYYLSKDVSQYIELQKILIEQGRTLPPELSSSKNVKDILNYCNAQYFTNGLESFREINDNSVDLVFSQAVLEHISRDDFLSTMLECKRILKQNAISSHQIDLRDHLGGALNNLRFSEKVWESNFFSKSGFYTNRIQYSQMLSLFKEAGFTNESNIIKQWNKLPTPRNRMSVEFKNIQDDELRVAVFDVLLR